MKTLLSAFFLAFSLAFSLSANAQTDAFTLRVEGLGCPFCAYGLEKKFKDVKGIDDLKIDIQTGKMTFRVPSATALTLEQADARVTKAGYTAKGIAVTRANGKTERLGDIESAVAMTDMDKDKSAVQQASFEAKGNCSMCKARIEKAAKGVAGVKSASWDVDTKQLSVEFDGKQTKLKDIQAAVAKTGHDNAGAKASDAAYDGLPACCQYRKA